MGLLISQPRSGRHAEVLTAKAQQFIEDLARQFGGRIASLLEARSARQVQFDAGTRPDFLPQTRQVREGEWKVSPLPAPLLDRRVEITGPVERKMIINALNSGASVFMADFEDSSSPTWNNLIEGQVNLLDAVRGTISYEDPKTGKAYAIGARPALLMVRPRGLHLPEAHVTLDGKPIAGALLDFGLFFFHNAAEQLRRGFGPYFYLPKLESHLEARMWNDVFNWSEDALQLPRGSIRATVLIETLPAAFEMDEILYELREHSAGLNCGRWDYIFSFIKRLKTDPKALMPDRSSVTMDQGFLKAYSERVIQVCHRRGVHAMGGMAAQIPIKGDEAANTAALDKVRKDKLREVKAGHDGTWVAHPALVPIAKKIFDAHMPGPNQIGVLREDVRVGQAELLAVPEGKRTLDGLRHNVRVGVQYLEAWLRGSGCVPLYNLMEDAATAEISRAQIWQWRHHKAALADGTLVTAALIEKVLDEELAALGPLAKGGRFALARELFLKVSCDSAFEEFLTLPAYPHISNL